MGSLNNRLVKFLERNKLICDNQIGFRKKARTSDHIFILNTLFNKFCSNNKRLYLCFVDFRKAYDKVWQDALMLKLLKMGIKGNFFGTIRAMYENCNSCIKSNGMISNTFECKSGVKQGDVLSPNLFNIYINDLPNIFDGDADNPKLGELSIHCLMYADDLVIVSLTEDGLQRQLDKLCTYCKEWDLTINVKKTQVMAMSNSSKECPNSIIRFGEETLEWVKTYKYLGVMINANGNFTSSSENLCIRGWKAVFKIKSALKDVNINPELKLKLFDALVKPIICYNCEIWGVANNIFNSKNLHQVWERVEKLPIERFQLKFCRGILGVQPNTHKSAIMGELGRLPLFLYTIKSTLNYLKHINEVKTDRPLLNAAIEVDNTLCISKSWKKRLTKLLSLFNVNTDNVLDDNFISTVFSNLKNSYLKYWKDSLGDKKSMDGKLYIYRNIKNHFGMEPYLRQIVKFKFRKALTAFRLSAHNLEIERGRYIRDKSKPNTNDSGCIRRTERFCTLCFELDKNKVIGDEEHAITNCPYFDDKRDLLFGKINSIVPNFRNLNDRNKLLYILTCENECAILASKFLNHILSTQRTSFTKFWEQFNNPSGV